MKKQIQTRAFTSKNSGGYATAMVRKSNAGDSRDQRSTEGCYDAHFVDRQIQNQRTLQASRLGESALADARLVEVL